MDRFVLMDSIIQLIFAIVILILEIELIRDFLKERKIKNRLLRGSN